MSPVLNVTPKSLDAAVQLRLPSAEIEMSQRSKFDVFVIRVKAEYTSGPIAITGQLLDNDPQRVFELVDDATEGICEVMRDHLHLSNSRRTLLSNATTDELLAELRARIEE